MTENLSEETYRLEGVAFGLVDGLITCLGLVKFALLAMSGAIASHLIADHIQLI